MRKLSNSTVERILLGFCVFVFFVLFPGIMLFWKTHPSTNSVVPLELPENSVPPPLMPGTKAVDFTSTTLDGKSYVFDSQSKNIKIVDFWATWCVPCRALTPDMEDLDNSLKGCGVQMIGVSCDTFTANRVKFFTKVFKMHYQVLVNPEKNTRAQKVYNASGLPSLYVIDGKGIVRWSYSGYWPGEEDYLRQVVNEVQTGQPVSP